jgi:hypothetical protein
VIRNFNADGFTSLSPRYKGGRPPKFTLGQRREVKKVATSQEGQAGRPVGRGEQRRDRLHADELVGLNRVEAQFTALRYFALDGADHATPEEQGSMIRRYIIIWRNNHAYDERLRQVVARANVS